MNVLLTGASGRVGTAITDHLSADYSFECLDREPHPVHDSITADVSNLDTIRAGFDEKDAVVHLAGDSSTEAPWQSVLENNIIGTYNCLEAAREAEVESFVFASSNHVVGMYEEEFAPSIYDEEFGLVLDENSPPRPDSFYGTSKLFGEAMGRQYVEKYDYPKRFYALRIASVRESQYDHPFGDAERGVADGKFQRDDGEYRRKVRRLMATWHSRRDLAQLVQRCLDDRSVEFDIFYGVSDNASRWFDLEHSRAVLGYRPEDRADEWSKPPEDEA